MSDPKERERAAREKMDRAAQKELEEAVREYFSDQSESNKESLLTKIIENPKTIYAFCKGWGEKGAGRELKNFQGKIRDKLEEFKHDAAEERFLAWFFHHLKLVSNPCSKRMAIKKIPSSLTETEKKALNFLYESVIDLVPYASLVKNMMEFFGYQTSDEARRVLYNLYEKLRFKGDEKA